MSRGISCHPCMRLSSGRGATFCILLIGAYGRWVRVGGVNSLIVHFKVGDVSIRGLKYQCF